MSLDQLIEFIGNHPILWIGLVIVVVMIITNEVSILTSGTKSIIPQMAVLMRNQQDALFVDTRSDAEFEKSHIVDAVHFPSAFAEDRLKTLEKHKETPLILYSQNGGDLQATIKLLLNNDFVSIHELRGGITAWTSENMPVQKKRKK